METSPMAMETSPMAMETSPMAMVLNGWRSWMAWRELSFYDIEPPGAISSIGWFIYTGCYFVTDNFDELVMATM
jgi:hypothetical protein